MDATRVRTNDDSRFAFRSPRILGVLLVHVYFSFAALTCASQDSGHLETGGAVADATRLIPLYYMRDTATVIALVRDPATPPSRPAVSQSNERLEALLGERRRLQARQAAILSQGTPRQDGVQMAMGLLRTPSPLIDQDLENQDLENIEQQLRTLDEQEQSLRADAFMQESRYSPSVTQVVPELCQSTNVVDRVRMTVVGEGLLHLRGPLAGVNAITRMVHEIDQPVGQVKIGIHVVQFTGEEGASMEGIYGTIERYLGHARQMSKSSQLLFRTALGNVAAKYQTADANQFEETFFYGPCMRNFAELHGIRSQVSIAMLDSRDIVTTLFLVGLANHDARRQVLTEFKRLVAAELPKMEKEYQQAITASQQPPMASPSFFKRLTKPTDAGEDRESHLPDLRFAQTMAYLDAFGEQANSVNAIQIATARFQRAMLELRQNEVAVKEMRNDRMLLTQASLHSAASAQVRTVSGESMDSESFGRLADHVIEEQAARLLDLREVVRAEVAALDGQLKALTTAFEEDLRWQFYKPALEDLRRSSGAWKSRMGQIESTTIRTNDRMLARVSPGQVAVMDRPVRPVLLQEGLQVATGIAQEAESLTQNVGMLAASEMVVPGSSGVLARTGLLPAPGKHLGDLIGASERIAVSVGDDISITPVIQPDGFSVAFHLVYTHTPHRETRGTTQTASGVQRHLIEADVQIPSLELQEVSRFRVDLDSEEQGKGIPLLEDVPGVGALFRPRRAVASKTQENIILVEAVVYPTALALSEKSWLAVESDQSETTVGQTAGTSGRGDELSGWVVKTLRRQAHARIGEQGDYQPMIQPFSGPVPASLEQPMRP